MLVPIVDGGMAVTHDNPEPSGRDFDWSWTEDEPDWVPPGVDITTPSPARMYDYALGGKDNFEVDRQAARDVMRVVPEGPAVARANRGFLVRSVRHLSGAGIDQFLDLGTGIPTSPSVHEVARRACPDARAVYVDHDPMVLAYNRALLARERGVTTVMHDLRDPAAVLSDPAVRAVIDLDRPVGLLMFAVLHFVDLVLAPEVVRSYLRRLAPGSYLAASAATSEGGDPAAIEQVTEVYRHSSSPVYFRTRAQIEEFFEGLTLVEPGLVDVGQWRNGHGTLSSRVLAGVGRKA